MRLTDLLAKASWAHLYGVVIPCGIGSTASLFIGLLTCPTSAELKATIEIGVLAGSTESICFGVALLLGSRPELSRTPAGL